jgi:hypothetical protein
MRNVARDCNGFLRFVGGSSKGDIMGEQNETRSASTCRAYQTSGFRVGSGGHGDNPKWAHGRTNEADGPTSHGAHGTQGRLSLRYGGQ